MAATVERFAGTIVVGVVLAEQEKAMARLKTVLAPVPSAFAAIDFETADYGRDSACAVGVVRVERNKIVESVHHLIRPPRRDFIFTYIHGITWEDVADAPTFRQLWPSLRKRLEGIEFLAAHNASFDRSVLNACCEHARLRVPSHSFHCTMKNARHLWNMRPTTLPHVCKQLRIRLNHHDAESDARACARIMIAAIKAGWRPE